MEDPTLSGRKRRTVPRDDGRDPEDITGPIRKLRRREHHRTELAVAYMRLLVLAGLFIVRLVQFLWPAVTGAGPVSATMFYPAGVYTLVALAVLVYLRRGGYAAWLGPVLALTDGIAIAVVNLQASLILGPEAYISETASLALICALFAASGGLNVTRWEAIWTGLVSLGVFAVSTQWLPGRRMSPGGLALNLVLLALAGLLGIWSTRQIRRALRGKLGQVTLARFVPRKLLDDAYHDPLALLEEPRSLTATVLVTDIRGFTKLAETMPPARILELLNEIQGALAQVVYDHGGMVDKFMGDGMLAVFGAPEPREDHAVCGLRAAEAIRPAMETINRRILARGMQPIKVGLGLHSGSLVAGCLGAGPRLEFTIIGDTVNTASRLESMTKNVEVDALISAATLDHALAAGYEAPVVPVGRLNIRGRHESLMVFSFGRAPDQEPSSMSSDAEQPASIT